MLFNEVGVSGWSALRTRRLPSKRLAEVASASASFPGLGAGRPSRFDRASAVSGWLGAEAPAAAPRGASRRWFAASAALALGAAQHRHVVERGQRVRMPVAEQAPRQCLSASVDQRLPPGQ